MITQAVSLYKNAYRGLSPSTWWLSLVMLINRSGTMVVPFMTIYLTQHLGVSISRAGLVMSLFGLGAIAGALIGGRLTDKIGSYYIQLFTLIGGGIMFIVLGQMASYPSICVCTFFLAMVNEAFRPANSVAIAHYSSEENRTRSYSLNRLAINLGWGFGGGLGGFIASYDYTLLFWVDGLTNICAAILLYIVLSPAKNAATAVTAPPPGIRKNSAYRDRVYLTFIIMAFVFAMCFFQLFTTIPVFFKEQFHLRVFVIGLIMTLNGLLIAFFEMVLIFKLEGTRPPLRYISAGVFLTGVSFTLLTLPFFNYALLAIISMLVVTAGEMLAMPFMNAYWIGRTASNNRGQYAALYTVSWAMAQAAGPLIGSLVAEKWGYNVLWILIGVICALLAFVYRKL